MLLERTELTIREGQEEAFAAAMDERGMPLIRSVSGVVSAQIGRGVESPNKFLLLVHWRDMDAHMAFTQTSALQDLTAIMMPFAAGGAMEHFTMSGGATP